MKKPIHPRFSSRGHATDYFTSIIVGGGAIYYIINKFFKPYLRPKAC